VDRVVTQASENLHKSTSEGSVLTLSAGPQ
jgi:hypothetical protein